MRALFAACLVVFAAGCGNSTDDRTRSADTSSDAAAGDDASTDARVEDAGGQDATRDDAVDEDVPADAVDAAGDGGGDAMEDIVDAADDAAEDAGADTPPIPDVPAGTFPTDAVSVVVHALDIWGLPMVADDVELEVASDATGTLPWFEAAGAAWTALPAEGTFTLRYAGADGFVPITLDLAWSGVVEAGAVLLGPASDLRAGVAVRRVEATADDGPVVHLYLGLRHRFFASTARAARPGNEVTFLMDGEEKWTLVAERLAAADSRVHIATWWWESDFELTRSDEIEASGVRANRTILSALESNDATTRVIVWDNIAVGFFNTDAAIEDRGEAPGDDFEYMPQENAADGEFFWSFAPVYFPDRAAAAAGVDRAAFDVTTPLPAPLPGRIVDPTDFPLGLSFEAPLASWHQKIMVIDGDEAFISGMNIKSTDWDTTDHLIFDHRRMEFSSDAADRQAVLDRDTTPDLGPRKDYAAHVRGPIARDVDETFRARWQLLLDGRADNAEASSPFALLARPAPLERGVWAQLVNTMPAPFEEYGILESHLNAIRAAEDYIYIEDQYWRAPMLLEALLARMEEVPGLRLIVVTKPVSEFVDPGCEWTHRMHAALSDAFPTRYLVLQLRAFDTSDDGFIGDETNAEFADIDVHSKLMIVDDVFLSVGSCNKNNRGYVYEGESNLNVYDGPWVRQARDRVVANLLDVEAVPFEWFSALRSLSESNAAVFDRWDEESFDLDLDGVPLPPEYRPRGFVYPLTFRTPDDCLIEGIGPDVAGEGDKP